MLELDTSFTVSVVHIANIIINILGELRSMFASDFPAD